MIAVIKHKRHLINTLFFFIIIYKFRHRQESYSFILPSINKSSKIDLYYTILSLDWAICLKIQENKKFLLNTEKIAYQKPEFRGKQKAAIT